MENWKSDKGAIAEYNYSFRVYEKNLKTFYKELEEGSAVDNAASLARIPPKFIHRWSGIGSVHVDSCVDSPFAKFLLEANQSRTKFIKKLTTRLFKKGTGKNIEFLLGALDPNVFDRKSARQGSATPIKDINIKLVENRDAAKKELNKQQVLDIDDDGFVEGT